MNAEIPTYGARIKAARKKLGRSIEAFAAELDVSRSTQINYENGITIPTIAYLDRCLLVGISPSELLECFNRGATSSKELDVLDTDLPVGLHTAIERHIDKIRDRGNTTPLYDELWTLFRQAYRAGRASKA